MVAEFQYVRPNSLEEACEVLAREEGNIVYAGGTDILVRLRAGKCVAKTVVDIKAIPELFGIQELDDHICIGAASTFSDLYENELIKRECPALAQAGQSVGSGQIQRKGTLGGNICNASPAADGLTALWALDTKVRLFSSTGTRVIPLTEFVTGPGKTIIKENEILCSILIPKGRWSYQAFFKTGKRNALAISIVNGCVCLRLSEQNRITAAAISIGACGPTPIRAGKCEKLLLGNTFSYKLILEAESIVKEEINPISDIRASADYRKYCTGTGIRIALEECRGRKTL